MIKVKTIIISLFLFTLAGVSLAAEWRTSEYFLPFFAVGKSFDIKFSATIIGSDNGGSKWNRGYSIFFRDTLGNPLAFPGVTFTGEPFSSDSRNLYVYDRGTAKIQLQDDGSLVIGWMSAYLVEYRADEADEFQPPIKLYGRKEARKEKTLLYSFMTEFKRPDTDWSVELVEKGTWVSILNPGPSAVVVNFNLWDDKETSNIQQRGGPRPFTKNLAVNTRSTESEFVEAWFPQVTRGRLEVRAPLPIVISAVQRAEGLVTVVPVSPGKLTKQ